MTDNEQHKVLIDVQSVDGNEVKVEFCDVTHESFQMLRLHPSFLPPNLQVGDALVLVKRATNIKHFSEAALALFAGWLKFDVEDLRRRLQGEQKGVADPAYIGLTMSHVEDTATLLDQYARQLPTVLFAAVQVYAQLSAHRAAQRVLVGDKQLAGTVEAKMSELANFVSVTAQNKGLVATPASLQVQLLTAIAMLLDVCLQVESEAGYQLSHQPG